MDNSRGDSLRIYLCFMVLITAVALSTRFCSRWLCQNEGRGSSTFWWDDWLAFASFPFFLVPVSLLIYMVGIGLGEHALDIPAPQLSRILELLFIAELLYNVSVTLAKTSALFFYRRVFTTRQRFLKYGFWVCMFLIVGWDISFTFATIFLCSPVQEAWHPYTAGGSCRPVSDLWFWNALTAIVVDLFILLLPIPIIWSLQMNIKRKLWMAAAFLTGYSVVFITIGRLVVSITDANQINVDLTYAGIPYLFWTAAEAPVAVIGVSIPPIFLRIRKARIHKLVSSHLRSKAESSVVDSQVDNGPSRSLGMYHGVSDSSHRLDYIPDMAILDEVKEESWYDDGTHDQSHRTSDTSAVPDPDAIPNSAVSNKTTRRMSWFRRIP